MKVFYDSSILIENDKGNEDAAIILREAAKISHTAFINSTVVSEVTYVLRKKNILPLSEIKDELSAFSFLECNAEIISLAFELMEMYNLKPNDAIILAS